MPITRLTKSAVRGSKKQHGKIDADLVKARQTGGSRCDEDAQCRKGERQSDQAAGNSEHRALKQQSHGDVGAPGAESGANGQFLAAAFNAHQQQIGDVGAGNQQHHHNRSHQDPEDISYIANHILFEGVKVCVDLDLFKDRGTEPLGRRKAVNCDGQQAIQIRVGLFQGHAGFELGNSAKTEVAELDLAAIHLHGQKHSGVVVVEELEISGQDADDLAVGAVNVECSPHDGIAAAEFLLPVAVGENDGLGCVGRVVAAREKTTQDWPYAEHGQRSVGHIHPRNMLWCSHAGDGAENLRCTCRRLQASCFARGR